MPRKRNPAHTSSSSKASKRKSSRDRKPHRSPAAHSRDAVLHGFFESVPDAVVVVDADGRIVRANAQVQAMFGYRREDLIGEPVEILLPERYRGKHVNHRIGYAAQPRTRSMGADLELYGRHQDGGEFPVDIMLSPLQRSNGALVITIIRDISERKQVENALRKAHEQLEMRVEQRTRELAEANRALRNEMAERLRAEEALLQVQKLEAIGQLTGGVAHDFNNLLTVISGNLQMLQERVAHVPLLLKLADAAAKAASRGAELTRNLLAFSRRQPLQPREIDIGELVHNMTDMMRRTLGESIHIETAIQAGLAKVAADPGQLENALLNLALNARDAMPRGGELTIKAATTLADAIPGEDKSDMAPGEYVMLAVSDNGSGMPPEVLKRVFEPFFTTKTTGKGSGLGLATVYGFVKQSGGHVRIYSEISRGTTVQLYLPQAKSNNEALVKEYASSHAPRAEGETVLLVEDNEGVRELAAAFLQDLGYAVFEAADAQQALAILEEGRPIDLLFTDLVMPGGMNGLELSREALRRRPTMKVLHTSGYMENALAHDGQFDVSIQLITKPYTKEALAQRIRLVLEQ